MAKRILLKIRQYAANPAAMVNNVRVLTGTDLIRLRVGDWRVLMRDDQVIAVIRIAPRGSAYDDR